MPPCASRSPSSSRCPNSRSCCASTRRRSTPRLRRDGFVPSASVARFASRVPPWTRCSTGRHRARDILPPRSSKRLATTEDTVSVRRRKDGRWQIDIVVWRGKERIRIRKSARARNRWEALDKEREERAKLEAGAPLESAIPIFRHFVNEFLETYAVTNNKPSEVETKRAIVRLHLEPEFGALRLDTIGPQDIERYKAKKIAAGLNPKTINNHLTVLRRVLAVAAE